MPKPYANVRAGPLPAGHGRKESDFAGAGNPRIRTHVAMVDRSADHFRILESVSIFFAAPGEPGHQLADRGNVCRRIETLFRLAQALAHPGKIQKLHASSRVKWCNPA